MRYQTRMNWKPLFCASPLNISLSLVSNKNELKDNSQPGKHQQDHDQVSNKNELKDAEFKHLMEMCC